MYWTALSQGLRSEPVGLEGLPLGVIEVEVLLGLAADDEVAVVQRQDVRGQGFDREPAIRRDVLPGGRRRNGWTA